MKVDDVKTNERAPDAAALEEGDSSFEGAQRRKKSTGSREL